MSQSHAVERIINLTFALLNAEKNSMPYLTTEWVIAKVPGYAKDSEGKPRSIEASIKLFERDRKALKKVGVPIETVSTHESTGYRIRHENYELPTIDFTPEEATILALAGKMGLSDELAVFSRSGWTKLAASGLNTTRTAPPAISAARDWMKLSAHTLDILMRAISEHRRISFTYTRNQGVESEERWMDPWGIARKGSNLYLIGFDLDRDAPRAFRSTRLDDFHLLDTQAPDVAEYGPFHVQPPETDLGTVLDEILHQPQSVVSATFTAKDPSFATLMGAESQTDSTEDTYYHLANVNRDWLIHTAAALTPNIVIVEPHDVARDVVSLLKEAV